MEHVYKAVTSGQGMVTIEALRQVGSPGGPTTPQQGSSAPSEETAHPPQSVGREFVRQYYTMLHRAPEQLHRFYSQNSSFLHEHWGGFRYDERPAIGQIEIYNKIKEMNFRDCHAKIFQVDSQLSVCQTVIVQVLGELSNNGEPLRKFMQTFVLVPQTNKKYYVHNDIFRYQDDDLDLDFGFQQHSQPVVEQQECVDNGEVVLEEFNEEFECVVEKVEETSTAAVCVMEEAVPVAADESNEPNRAAESPDDELNAGNELKEVPISDMVEQQDETASSPEVVADAPQAAAELASSELKQEIEEVSSSSKQAVEKKQLPAVSEIKETATPPQRLSWAEMASRNVGSAFKPLTAKFEQKNGSPVVMPVSQVDNVNSVGSPSPAVSKNNTPNPAVNQYVATKTQVFRGDNNYQQQQQQQHSNVVDDTGSNSGKSMQYYPDQQQIFVGNLPHHMSDQDLKEFFEKYGRVLDIRINRKPNNNLPNFGFIAFDCAETVKYILSLRPLYNGRFRVNVEEKKRREDLIGCRPRSGQQHSMANQNQNGVTNGNEQPHKEEAPIEQKVSGC